MKTFLMTNNRYKPSCVVAVSHSVLLSVATVDVLQFLAQCFTVSVLLDLVHLFQRHSQEFSRGSV